MSETSIESFSVPVNLKQICDGAFYACKKLKTFDIPVNSKLQMIGKTSFLETSIERIFIPKQVAQICKNLFEHCRNLKIVEFPPDSCLQSIESESFQFHQISEKLVKICFLLVSI